MTRFYVFAFILSWLLRWTVADAAPAPANLPSPPFTPPASTSNPAAPSPGRSDALSLRSFSIGPRWSGSWEERRPLVLEVRLLLDSAPDDWLQVSARVPSGYRSGERGPGEWLAFYFLTHSPAATFEINLQPGAAAESTVSFPLLVQAGGRITWLSIHLNGTDSGYAAALVEIDAKGNPRWFPDPDAPAGLEPRPTSYWSLTTSVSDAFAFIADVLQLDLYTPDYLSPWCGADIRPESPQTALSQVGFYAGCEVKRLGESEYAVEFAESYRGAPDTSWFVVWQSDGLRVHANGAPAADLIPALLASAGATIAASPDLAASSITCEWRGSPRSAVEIACASARPPLTWAERDGVFSFAAHPGN